MPVRILVADDHEVVLQGIRMILQSRPDWEICGEALNGTEAIQMAQQLRPDAIIMDITMPITNGLTATREISALGIKSPVLMFTMHDSKGLIESVQAVGGKGIVYKSVAARDLIAALEVLLGGGTYFPSESKDMPLAQTKKANHGVLRSTLRKSVLSLWPQLVGFLFP